MRRPLHAQFIRAIARRRGDHRISGMLLTAMQIVDVFYAINFLHLSSLTDSVGENRVHQAALMASIGVGSERRGRFASLDEPNRLRRRPARRTTRLGSGVMPRAAPLHSGIDPGCRG